MRGKDEAKADGRHARIGKKQKKVKVLVQAIAVWRMPRDARYPGNRRVRLGHRHGARETEQVEESAGPPARPDEYLH